MHVATTTDRPPRTLAGEVLARLRDDIVWCRLRPGAPLRFEQLRDTYGASFTTLREALTALVADGLAVSEGQRGFRVAPVGAADLIDLTEARVLVERQLLALAIEKGGDEWEVAAAAAFHRMSLVVQRHGPRTSSTPEWKLAHAQFHLALVAAADSPILLAFRDSLYARAERYRTLCAVYRKSTPNKAGEHKAILDGALARNTEKAVRLIDRHIRATTSEVLEHATELFDD
jgi:DNA-binding GntR family transcriptional regulator